MFFCKTAPFLGQKQASKKRIACKLLPLCGLARQKNRQSEGEQGRNEGKGMIVKGMNMKAKP